MDTHKIDADFITSLINLAASVLALIVVAGGIVNAKLQKAKTVVAREKVIGTTIDVVAILFVLIGLILNLLFGIGVTSVSLFAIACIVRCIDYIRHSEVPSRAETLRLVIYICATVSLVELYLLSRLTQIFEKQSDLINRMLNILQNH